MQLYRKLPDGTREPINPDTSTTLVVNEDGKNVDELLAEMKEEYDKQLQSLGYGAKWVQFTPVDDRIQGEDPNDIFYYKKVGNVVYFKIENYDRVVLDRDGGLPWYNLISLSDLGVEEGGSSTFLFLWNEASRDMSVQMYVSGGHVGIDTPNDFALVAFTSATCLVF